MYDSDRDELIATLRKHFTGSIEGDGELIWTKVKGMDLEDVVRSIEEHRLECGKAAYRPDIRRIVALAIEYRNAKHKISSKKFRVIDWIKSASPDAYASVPDASAIDDHFRECWSAVKANAKATGYGRQMARAYILAHARNAFREIRLTEGEGERSARLIVELGPEERISGGQTFRTILPLKDSAGELKKLADYISGISEDGQ